MKFQLRFILCITMLFLAVSACSQKSIKSYTAEWKKVEEYENKGLPQSALAEVNKIYEMSKKDKQDAQVVKALVKRLSLQNETREDHYGYAISSLKEEINSAKEPARSILHTLLAETYLAKYQSLRWQLLNRTDVAEAKSDDPATWSAADFMEAVSEHFQKSLENESLLKNTGLAEMDPIITTKGNVRHLRPTLFDLLAHRALAFFATDERTISKPAYVFEIDQAEAFAPAPEFASFAFTTKDSLSLEHKALQLYQALLKFHREKGNTEALIDADIQRITYVYGKSVHPDKEQLYAGALTRLIRDYGNLPASAQASNLLAQWHYGQSQSYAPYGDTTNRYAAVKAIEIADGIIARFPDSEGGVGLHSLKQEILARSLVFNVEKVNVPGKPFLLSLRYKNQSKVHFRVIKATEALRNTGLKEGQEKLLAALDRAAALKTWEQDVPETKDYQVHTVELPVEPLPVGEYYLVASGSASLRAAGDAQAVRLFYVSNISFVSQGQDYFVLDRDSGQPLEGAKVQVWNQRYMSQGYQREKGESYTADKNGHFKLKRDRSSGSFLLEFNHRDDHLLIDEQQYAYYQDGGVPTEKITHSALFFTDRSIYRPGQALHFKGIVLSKASGQTKSEIVTGRSLVVELFDANGQKVDSSPLVSNEYGSVSGTFQLPVSGLNGVFRIAASGINGASHFRVEEYKRPKYKVEIEEPVNTYKVNETVTVTGHARAFAGNNIDGANVKYRVERVARFPYPWLFFRGWFPVSAPLQITHGETVTDKDGKFKVSFTAIPDRTIARENKPVFDYVVYADVTDGSGETRSASRSVSVSYQSVILKADIPEQLERDSLQALNIRTENTNGVFVPAEVAVTIRRLAPEPRLIRGRLWERPDQFVLSKEAFVQRFPHDEYDNENNPESWAKSEVVWSGKKATTADGKWVLDPAGTLEGGFYELELVATGADGEPVKDVRRVELSDRAARSTARPQYLWVKGSSPVEPGNAAAIGLGTSSGEVFLIRTLDKSKESIGRKSFDYRFFQKHAGLEEYRFDVTEDDRGGYGAGFLFVKHNRVFQHQEVIRVPWTNKELEITYGTFRDKTLPGSSETWTLTVSGKKGEKVAAELLAGMYDASLDEFVPHEWQKPPVWPEYFGGIRWTEHFSFGAAISQQSHIDRRDSYKSFRKQYDELIGFDWQLNEVIVVGYGRQNRAMVAGAVMAAPAAEETADKVVVKKDSDGGESAQPNESAPDASAVDQPARKDFRETAFFFPVLKTGADGSVTFSFTMPEALTKWKFQALSHTKELALGYSTQEIVTQKELMVQPNIPRFIRTGDQVSVSTRIVNLSEKVLEGTARMSVLDAATGGALDQEFGSGTGEAAFSVAPGESKSLLFPVNVPAGRFEPVTFRITAKAGQFSDGEDNTVPVLTNRMLVTETMPLSLRGTGSRSFSFDKLRKSGSGGTLKNQGLTVEYTANPAWYAVQALPYLMEYPYECAEQTWNRYYANALATHIAHSTPRIDQLFKTWRDLDTSALLSNLQKNQELKSLLLEETPWVLAAKSEAEQKRNLALLFDLTRMKGESAGALDKLQKMQGPEGNFPWFSGGPADRYVTQYIVTGIGHLMHLSKPDAAQATVLNAIVERALSYLDGRMAKDYESLVKNKADLKNYTPSPLEVQYFYMRSFFTGKEVSGKSRKAYDFYKDRVAATWLKQSRYMQAMTALALSRTGNKSVPAAIMKSLKESAIRNEELGTYWKSATRSWWWQDAPIEQHALFIEAFDEVTGDKEAADEIRTWLLTNKRTNRWESTKATAEACYALLLRGSEWLNDNPEVKISLGQTVMSSADGAEAGTGYFRKQVSAADVKPEHGNIQVTVSSASEEAKSRPSWGGVYWQYFEDLDKITFSETPLKLKKQLFTETNSDRGPVLKALADGNEVKVGDRIKVRIELTVDRDMEYVHMKDMRASGLEPVNVLSSFKWQGGLGYYETTKDAATNFFFNYLPKGKYVFEYPLNVSHQGNFSNGVTTIQCMYAPEFTAHSEGIRLRAAQ